MDEEHNALADRVKIATARALGDWDLGDIPATRGDLAKGLTSLAEPLTSLSQAVTLVISGEQAEAKARMTDTLTKLVEFTEFVAALVSSKAEVTK